MCERVKRQKDLIKNSFKKCGLFNNLSSSKDGLINIKSIKGYKIPLSRNEIQMIEEIDSEDDDEDDDDDDDGDGVDKFE